MANDERCIHCGRNETYHEFHDCFKEDGTPCPGFESEITHKDACPVLDCNGDCDATIAKQRAVDEAQMRRWDAIEH